MSRSATASELLSSIAARAQVPLALPPGVYRTGMLYLQSGSQLVGVRGATKFLFNGGASMLQGEGANSIGLHGLTLDGGGSRTRMTPISHMTFDEDAKITSMRAFWSPSDAQVL